MFSATFKSTIRDAAQKLTGSKKREFIAQVCLDYCNGSARNAETHFGWGRNTVQKGLEEKERGILYHDNYRARGRKPIEETLPNLVTDLKSLVEPHTQADPKFQTTFQYTRISARAVREALIKEFDYRDEGLPSRQTIGVLMNRLGYRLKKHSRPAP